MVVITAASSLFVPSGPQDFFSQVCAQDCPEATYADIVRIAKTKSFFMECIVYLWMIKFTGRVVGSEPTKS
jgi:hypothetical protein